MTLKMRSIWSDHFTKMKAKSSRWSEAESRWPAFKNVWFLDFVWSFECTKDILKEVKEIFLDSSMVERTAVNRDVVGSSPTRGAQWIIGSVVKRLRHRPFTAVTRVRFPSESLEKYADVAQFSTIEEERVNCRQSSWLQISWKVTCRCGSIGRAADL